MKLKSKKHSSLNRRDFIKKASLASLSIPFLLQNINHAFAQVQSLFSFSWLTGISPSINQRSILQSSELNNFIINKNIDYISLDNFNFNKINKTPQKKGSILALEGNFPPLNDEEQFKIFKSFLDSSSIILLIGNEASYDLFSNKKNESLMDLLLDKIDKPIIRIPGSPVNIYHILSTLNYLYFYGIPELDELRRPKMIFGEKICTSCEYRRNFEQGVFRKTFYEEEGCLYKLGCKGPYTSNSCYKNKWGNSKEWCISIGSPCTGCSEPTYPDHYGLGFYTQATNNSDLRSGWIRNLDKIVIGTSILTTSGIIAHTISQKAPNYLKNEQLNEFYEENILHGKSNEHE